MEIIVEKGIKWGVEKDKINGVWHYTRYNLGKVEIPKPESKEPKKNKKEEKD